MSNEMDNLREAHRGDQTPHSRASRRSPSHWKIYPPTIPCQENISRKEWKRPLCRELPRSDHGGSSYTTMPLDMKDLRWAVIGFGEVGSVLARHLAAVVDREVQVMAPRLNRNLLSDRQKGQLEAEGLKIVPDLGTLVQDSDVVLSAVTPGAAAEVAEVAAASRREALFVDLNSISPMEKARAAAPFGEGFVDGAILESFAGRGTQVPIALSGPRSREAHSLLVAAGLRTSVVSQEVGTASALKMCRSIFMKRLECLFVEASLAGRKFNLAKPLLETIEETFSSYTIRELSTMLLTTHAVHADRRAHEMKEVVETLRKSQLPSPLSRASRDLLAESVRADLAGKFDGQIPDDPDTVVQALSRYYEEQDTE